MNMWVKTQKYSLLVLLTLIATSVWLFLFSQQVHAETGVGCYETYDRLVSRGTDLSNRSEFVLVYIQQEDGDPAYPYIVCGEDAQGDNVKVGIAQWGITAGSLFGNPAHRGIHTYDKWAEGTNYFAFYNYHYEGSDRVASEYAYLEDDLTATIIPVGREGPIDTFVEDPLAIKTARLDPTKNQGSNDSGTDIEDGVDVESPGGSEESTEGEPTCTSDGPLSWILCPVAEGMLGALDDVVGAQLRDMLAINTSITQDENLRETWGYFVGVANILFVIGFLFIIFAQSFSMNIDAYTIKKSLPRLVVAVVGVQLSLFIAQFFIDIFNVLGYGVAALILEPIGGGADMSISFDILSSGTGGVADLLGSAAGEAGASIALAAGLGSAIWALIGYLPIILLAVIATVLLLALRRLAIVALILLAPLALVAWILPNTQKWTKEWFDNFTKMLVMFPIITGFIAIGKLFADINSNVTSGDGNNFINTVITLTAAYGPYLAIPFSYKLAGRAMQFIGGGIRSLQTRASGGGGRTGRTGSAGTGFMQKYQDRVKRARTTTAAGKGRVSGSRIGAPLRGLARPGTGVTSRSRRNAQLAYAQSVMSGAKELSESDPEMMQNKDLRRVMQYGSLGKARKQVDKFKENGQHAAAEELQKSIDAAGSLAKGRNATRQQRASLLYASAANGDVTVADMLGSGDLAGSDPKQHEAFLNSVVGKTVKGSGNFGASAGFRVDPNTGSVTQDTSEVAQKIIQADPSSMARDKNWYMKLDDNNRVVGAGDTRKAAEEALTDPSRRDSMAFKLRQTMSYAGTDTQQSIERLLRDAGISDTTPIGGPTTTGDEGAPSSPLGGDDEE